MAGVCLLAAPARAEEEYWGFETDMGRWTALSCSIRRTDEEAREGEMSLEVSRQFPGCATIVRSLSGPSKLDINQTPRLSYAVFVPESAGPTVKTLLFFKNKDGLWYQCLRRRPLLPGRWTTVRFDLSPGSAQVEPFAHFRRWSSAAAAEMQVIGIKIFSRRRFRDRVLVDAIQLEPARGVGRPDLVITDFRVNTTRVPRFGKFEITFDLSRSYTNPFDHDRIAVDAEFTGPDGKKEKVPGFYYQDFVRVDRVTKLERGRLLEDFVPVGPGVWKIRYAPRTVGRYAYRLTVADRSGAEPDDLSTRRREFSCVRSTRKGYVQVAKDGKHFEFSTGEPFYPIGHNVHSSNDVSDRNCTFLGIRPPDDHGTKAYEDLFTKMGAHGENVAEVWLASWSLDIEWTHRWKHYFGLGRYNLHHAWKLDRLLELAEKNGLLLHLVLENHGKVSTFCDPEWRYNPFNEDNNGFLSDAKDFFTRLDARDQYKKKLRYIVARWGYATTIMGFELWSELDLTGNKWRDHEEREFLEEKVRWHRAIAQHLKKIDLGRHVLTTHYSGDFRRVQPEIAEIKEIDYLALDAYRGKGSVVELLYNTLYSRARGLRTYGKPVLITEYGGAPKLQGSDRARLEADLHAGIWSAYMMDHSGTPLLWWFMFIDRHDQYHHYRALARFAHGEDRRNRKLQTTQPVVSGAGPGAHWVSALVLKNSGSAYGWAYDRRSALEIPSPTDRKNRRHSGLTLDLRGLEPGGYVIEFWDTYTGKVVKTVRKIVEGPSTTLQIPLFTNDIAFKVKPSRGARRE